MQQRPQELKERRETENEELVGVGVKATCREKLWPMGIDADSFMVLLETTQHNVLSGGFSWSNDCRFVDTKTPLLAYDTSNIFSAKIIWPMACPERIDHLHILETSSLKHRYPYLDNSCASE